jgi:hypothetical protein
MSAEQFSNDVAYIYQDINLNTFAFNKCYRSEFSGDLIIMP